jgi:hypothetical protein
LGIEAGELSLRLYPIPSTETEAADSAQDHPVILFRTSTTCGGFMRVEHFTPVSGIMRIHASDAMNAMCFIYKLVLIYWFARHITAASRPRLALLRRST